jgi:GNAT superfamily N-acetyltransferase
LAVTRWRTLFPVTALFKLPVTLAATCGDAHEKQPSLAGKAAKYKQHSKMTIQQCQLRDTDTILSLYEEARNLQTERKMVVWPYFENTFIQKEIREGRQWKLVVNDVVACNWAITFEDKEIWEEKDQNDAVYIHRICTHPKFRGNRYIDIIVDWAKAYALQQNKRFVRLDTLGDNRKLIHHYTSAGFDFLGMFELTHTATLPAHYQQEPNCCLFQLEVAL